MIEKWAPTPRMASVVHSKIDHLDNIYKKWTKGKIRDVDFSVTIKDTISSIKGLIEPVEGCPPDKQYELFSSPCGRCGAEHCEPCRLKFKDIR